MQVTPCVGVVEALSIPMILPTRQLLEMASAWPASLPSEALQAPGHYRTIRRLRQDEVDEAVKAYRAGATVFDLAARFGVDRKTVWAWVEIGTLPKPIRMRRHSYFDLAVVERRILASAHL